jgi:hypothetical protein
MSLEEGTPCRLSLGSIALLLEGNCRLPLLIRRHRRLPRAKDGGH